MSVEEKAANEKAKYEIFNEMKMGVKCVAIKCRMAKL